MRRRGPNSWRRREAGRRVLAALFWAGLLAALGAGAALSVRYHLRWDWTAGGANTLSAVSRAALADLRGPVTVTVAARPGGFTRAHVTDLLARYRAVEDDLRLGFLDPADRPVEAAALGLDGYGAASVAYAGRQETTRDLTEAGLTEALIRVRQASRARVVSVLGQGGRRLLGEANHDLGLFARRLQARGFDVEEVEAVAAAGVSGAADLLVATEPHADPLPGMSATIADFLRGGGNLLWLAEPRPEPAAELAPLTELLGVRRLAGSVVQPKDGAFRALSPRIVLASSYPPHPATEGLRLITLFPTVAGLEPGGPDPSPAGWRRRTLLETGPGSRVDRGAPAPGDAPPGADDRPASVPGPIAFGVSYARSRPAAGAGGNEQRVVVLGDGDFLSNRYLANQANLELGVRLAEWLTAGARTVAVAPMRAPDRNLALGGRGLQILALGAVIGLPGALLLAGAAMRVRRRR